MSGEIPLEIRNLANLEELLGIQTTLTSSISLKLINLSLGSSYISGNMFHGTFPSGITALASLMELSVAAPFYSSQ